MLSTPVNRLLFTLRNLNLDTEFKIVREIPTISAQRSARDYRTMS